jgi:hypothetical protein
MPRSAQKSYALGIITAMPLYLTIAGLPHRIARFCQPNTDAATRRFT